MNGLDVLYTAIFFVALFLVLEVYGWKRADRQRRKDRQEDIAEFRKLLESEMRVS